MEVSIFSNEVIDELKTEIVSAVADMLINKKFDNSERDEIIEPIFVDQKTANKLCGSRSTREALEKAGLSRFKIEGKTRYKISEIEDIMEVFRD